MLGVKAIAFESNVPLPRRRDVPSVWLMFQPPFEKFDVVIEAPPEPASVVVVRTVKLFAPVPSEPL